MTNIYIYQRYIHVLSDAQLIGYVLLTLQRPNERQTKPKCIRDAKISRQLAGSPITTWTT